MKEGVEMPRGCINTRNRFQTISAFLSIGESSELENINSKANRYGL